MAEELLVLQETNQRDSARMLADKLSEQDVNTESERVGLPHEYRYVDPYLLTHHEVEALFRKVEIGKDIPDDFLLQRNAMAAAERFTPVDVAVQNGQDELVGFGSLFCRGEEGELGDFVVSPEYQGQGIGRAILLERMRLAKEKGITTLRIPGIEETNMLHLSEGKPSFYRELGFRSNEQEGGLIWRADALVVQADLGSVAIQERPL